MQHSNHMIWDLMQLTASTILQSQSSGLRRSCYYPDHANGYANACQRDTARELLKAACCLGSRCTEALTARSYRVRSCRRASGKLPSASALCEDQSLQTRCYHGRRPAHGCPHGGRRLTRNEHSRLHSLAFPVDSRHFVCVSLVGGHGVGKCHCVRLLHAR